MIKKTRSIYCTDSEYKRLKVALCYMRVFEPVPGLRECFNKNFTLWQQSEILMRILVGGGDD